MPETFTVALTIHELKALLAAAQGTHRFLRSILEPTSSGPPPPLAVAIDKLKAKLVN